MLPQDYLSQFAVVVSVQATLITLLAVVLAKVCKRDPKWSHRIWLSCVLMFLALPIAHWFVGGWPVRLESPAISVVIPALPAQITSIETTDKPTVKHHNAALVWTEAPNNIPVGAASRPSVAAKTNGAYNFSIRSLPGDQQRPGIGRIPGLMADKVLQADDFNLTEGFEEIAGVVVDVQGNPVVGASVYAAFRDNRSQLWYRHKASSKLTTDLWGRFHMKKVPEGIHQFRVFPPSVEGKRSNDVTVEAFTGDLEMRITLGN